MITIMLARKPLHGTVAANALKWGTGGLNIDQSRIGYTSSKDQASAIPQGRATSKVGALAGGTESSNARSGFVPDNTKGRFPANLILYPAALEIFPQTTSPVSQGSVTEGNTSSASRFFKVLKGE